MNFIKLITKRSASQRICSLLVALPVSFSFLYTSSTLAKTTTFNSHVHGLSELNIAIENQSLVIEMIFPASDLVGFEHKATTKQSINKVKMVEQQLNKYHEVFSLSGGHCKLINKFIDVSSLMVISEDLHKHHEQEDSHSEIIANYSYHCGKISTLSSVTVNVFQLFNKVNEVQTMWIRELKQGATILNTINNVIKFR